MTREMSLVLGVAAVTMLFACSPRKDPEQPGKTSAEKPEQQVPAESKVLQNARALVRENGNMDQCYNTRDQKDDNGIPLLVWAVTFSEVEAVKLLLKNGADPNIKVKARSQDPVLFEAISGVNIETSVRQCEKRRTETKYVCQLLLRAGADVNYRTNLGETALHKAASCGRDDICALLIEKKAGVNVADKIGTTPLHKAAKYGHWKAAALLIRNNANVNVKDRLGDSALKLAEERCEEDMYKGIRSKIPTAYPGTDYNRTIETLKAGGAK